MPNNDVVSVEQPRVSKRMTLAQICVETFGLGPDMSVLVDDPELGNPFESGYAPWLIHIYVIENGVMQFISEPTDCAHDVTELRTWLEQHQYPTAHCETKEGHDCVVMRDGYAFMIPK